MFGLGKSNEDKNKKPEFLFDLELEIEEAGSARKTKEMIQERLTDAKAILRSGQAKEEFDQVGLLLYGYTAVLKVVDRIEKKIKTKS